MKRAVSLTIIILGLSCAAWAQIGPTTNSFRSASTSSNGLFTDDLDLLIGYRGFLDPSRIPLVQGKRLYTSLANIVNKNEEVFNNNDNGYFLIGGSTKLMNYGSVGAFYDRLGKSTPLALDPAVYGTMFGHGDRTDVTLRNSGGQTLQDVVKRTADANADSVSTQILVGIGRYLMETKRVGIAFYHSDASQETKAWGDTLPANRFGNYTYDQTTTDLVTNQVSLIDAWKATQKGGNKASQNLIGLAGWMPYGEKYSVGLQFMGGLVSTSPEDEAKYTRTLSRPQSAPLETQTMDGNRKATFTSSGLSLDGKLSAIYKWSDATDTRCDLSFGMTNAKNKSGDKREVNVTNTYSGTFFTSDADTDHIAYSGTKDNTGRMEFYTRTYSKLSDKVTFAMGLGISSSNIETKLIGDETHNRSSVYTQNNGGPPSPNDSTATWTYTEKREFDTTGSALIISIPVGVEFHLTEPLVFRLGANHRISSLDLTATDQRVSWTAPTTHVVKGDGTSYDVIGLPGPFVSTGNTVKVKRSQTIYTYGAGWNFSENLQLDFMGFAHLDDLTNWKLSATFKF